MTKTRRNLTIYGSVILLFGLTIMIILMIIYQNIEVKNKFGNDYFVLGSYAVSDYEENLHEVSFRVGNAEDFIERHIVSHEHYIETLKDNVLLNTYFLFLNDGYLYTIKYEETDDMFYLYSGSLEVKDDDSYYVIPYIEYDSDDINTHIFTDYETLKGLYVELDHVSYFDILNTIEIEGYMIDRNTDQIDFNQDVLVRLTYIDDAVLITTSD